MVIALVLPVTVYSLVDITAKSLRTSAQNSVNAAIVTGLEAHINRHPHRPSRVTIPMQGSTVVEITSFAGTQVWAVSSAIATADKHFLRFVREDASRNKHSGGTGLGLAIVADIAKRHGGTARFIPVESGSTVELRVRRY